MSPIRSAFAAMTQPFRARFISGLMVIVPAGLTLIVLVTLFQATVGALVPVFRAVLRDDLPHAVVVLTATVFFIGAVYLVGLLTSYVVGKRLISLGERVVGGVPIAATVYSATKQIIEMFQSTADPVRKQVALVDFPATGLKALGFVTGELTLPDGSRCYSVFIPTTPNPTTGFLELVAVERVELLPLTAEEAIRFIMSGGLLQPNLFALKKSTAECTEEMADLHV